MAGIDLMETLRGLVFMFHGVESIRGNAFPKCPPARPIIPFGFRRFIDPLRDLRWLGEHFEGGVLLRGRGLFVINGRKSAEARQCYDAVAMSRFLVSSSSAWSQISSSHPSGHHRSCQIS